MKTRIAAAATLALLLAAPVAAQQNTPTPAEAQPAVRTVTFNGYEYDIGPDEPLVSYVIERTDHLDRTTVRIVTFVVLDSGAVVTVPPYETLATGPLADSEVGDALALEPVR